MRYLRALLAGVLALLLGGCATVPTSGPVESVPVGDQGFGVEIAPEPPQADISPRRLLEGFLQAMTDPEADYEVARQYLTSAVRDTWDPRSGARIYDATVLESNDTLRLVGVITGWLDEHGRFTGRHDPLDLDMALMQEDGEWRIARPPDGLLISQFMFDRYYAHPTIYFMSRTGDFVVPDLIHLPEALLTAERVVEAQLAGPGPDIVSSVRSALPGGTQLGELGASVDPQGVARVHLANLPGNLGEEQRRQLGAQLLWSLTAIGRVTGLEVFHDEQQLTLPGQNADGVLELASQQGYQVLSRAATPDLFGVRDQVAGRVAASGAFVPMASDGLPVTAVAVSLDAALVAFVDAERRRVLIGPLGGQLVAVEPGMARIREAQFVLGALWVLGEDAAGFSRLVRVDSQGAQTSMDLSLIPGRITAFAASQTGTRLALVVGSGEEATLGIAGMDGPDMLTAHSWTPLVLTDESGNLLTRVSAVSWSGEKELAVVARTQGVASVFLCLMDGALVEDLGPLGFVPTDVAALPRMGGDTVVVLSEGDQVLRYESGTRWTDLDLSLSQVAYAG